MRARECHFLTEYETIVLSFGENDFFMTLPSKFNYLRRVCALSCLIHYGGGLALAAAAEKACVLSKNAAILTPIEAASAKFLTWVPTSLEAPRVHHADCYVQILGEFMQSRQRSLSTLAQITSGDDRITVSEKIVHFSSRMSDALLDLRERVDPGDGPWNDGDALRENLARLSDKVNLREYMSGRRLNPALPKPAGFYLAQTLERWVSENPGERNRNGEIFGGAAEVVSSLRSTWGELLVTMRLPGGEFSSVTLKDLKDLSPWDIDQSKNLPDIEFDAVGREGGHLILAEVKQTTKPLDVDSIDQFRRQRAAKPFFKKVPEYRVYSASGYTAAMLGALHALDFHTYGP